MFELLSPSRAEKRRRPPAEERRSIIVFCWQMRRSPKPPHPYPFLVSHFFFHSPSPAIDPHHSWNKPLNHSTFQRSNRHERKVSSFRFFAHAERGNNKFFFFIWYTKKSTLQETTVRSEYSNEYNTRSRTLTAMIFVVSRRSLLVRTHCLFFRANFFAPFSIDPLACLRSFFSPDKHLCLESNLSLHSLARYVHMFLFAG